MPPWRQGGQCGAHTASGGPDRNEAGGALARGLPRTLRDLQRHEAMDRLRRAARSKRMAAFRGEVAIVINQLSIRMLDCLMVFLRGEEESFVKRRHEGTANIITLLAEVTEQPDMLEAWGYSAEQGQWLVDRIGSVIGAGRAGRGQLSQPGRAAPRGIGPVVDCPLLFPLFSALLSPELRLIPLAKMVADARRGCWAADDKSFVVVQTERVAEALGPLWEVQAGGLADLGPVTVVCRGNAIQWIELGERWPAIERPRCRQLLPAKCRLELLHPHADPARRSGLINVPRTDGTYITKAIGAWERRLGTLSLELRALLEGTYVISRSGQPFRPFFMRNHASLDEEAMDALWPTVAKMLWKGIFEYVERGDPLPRGIIPCGAVPKAGPPGKRLITDYRVTNVYQDPWPVKYISIRAISLVIGRNALWWSRDLAAAYYNGLLGGCGYPARIVVRWVISESGTCYAPLRSPQFGCGPGGCGGWCDKSLGGVCLAGHVMRFSTVQFGGRTSNGPLSLFVDAIYQILRDSAEHRDVAGGGFVDDLFFMLLMLWHGACMGLAGGCSLCEAAAVIARTHERFVDSLLDELHLERSDKHSPVGQVGVFLGVIIDSHLGRLFLTETKYAKLIADLRLVMTWEEASPRMASKVGGKLTSYSECIIMVKPFAVAFNCFIGGARTVGDWDALSPHVQRMQDSARYLLQVLPLLRPLGAPLWKLDVSTIYELVETGVDVGFTVFILTTDASIAGVGMAYRRGGGPIVACTGRRYEQLSAALTFDLDLAASGSLEHQVWREGFGAQLAFETMLMDEEVHDGMVIIRGDCAPALSCMEWGSSRSPKLQSVAEAIHKAAIPRGIQLGFLHVSGEQLIREGIDDGSRKHAKALLGPACGLKLKELVLGFARQHSPGITIDFFAAASNKLVPRYAAWTQEAGAELVDAFSARSWDHGMCVCGKLHRETGFYFPPAGLEDRVVRRAKSDGARCIFLVPTNRKAAYFMCLAQRCHASRVIVQETEPFVHTTRDMSQHTLFSVDFMERADRCSPACGQERQRRSSGRGVRVVEALERSALSQQLSALAGALHDA